MNRRYKILLMALIVILSVLLVMYEDTEYKKVKKGEYELQCLIRDKGWVTIDPSKVDGHDPESDCWSFTNGWACNCEVTK